MSTRNLEALEISGVDLKHHLPNHLPTRGAVPVRRLSRGTYDFANLRRLASIPPQLNKPKNVENTGSLGIPNQVTVFQKNRTSVFVKKDQCFSRFVLIVNLQGNGTVVLQERGLHLVPGEAVLVFPNQLHHFSMEGASELNWVFISFSLEHTRNVEKLRNRVLSLSKAGETYLSQLIHNSKHLPRSNETESSQSLLIGLVLLDLMPDEGRDTPAILPGRQLLIDQVIDFILENYADELKMSTITKNFPYSESHLRLMFRKHTGMSIGGYIQKVKIEKARSLLLGSDSNISEVADACGFGSLYSFSRAFKRVTGLSPRGYRGLHISKI